jgi:branched-chain amino acid aminotransferase
MYYNEETLVFKDGEFLHVHEAGIDPYSQTLHYGMGVFEGLRAYQTIHGTKIFKAKAHFNRLAESCELLGIPFDYSAEELIQVSYQLLEKNNLTCAYIRPIVISAPRMTLEPSPSSSLVITAWKWGKYFGDKSLRVCISSVERISPKACRVEAKVSGHYVNAVMAAAEARKRGYDEAIMLDGNGFVAQAPGSNLFYEKNGVLYTAPEGSVFPGITRKTVLDICKQLDIPVVEKNFRAEALLDVDAAFLCGTATEITPIHSVEENKVNLPWERSVSAMVQETYKSIVLDKTYSFVIV